MSPIGCSKLELISPDLYVFDSGCLGQTCPTFLDAIDMVIFLFAPEASKLKNLFGF